MSDCKLRLLPFLAQSSIALGYELNKQMTSLVEHISRNSLL